MKLFKKKEPTERITYNSSDLFRKEKENLPMTFGEVEALQREKNKELSNQILRILGLITGLIIIIFAVGTFLYPYSLLNFIPTSKGGDDVFWTQLSELGLFNCHECGKLSVSQIWDSWMKGFTLVTPEGAEEPIKVAINGWVIFYGIGAVTVVPLATAGFIAIIIMAIYVVAYNIKDLIAVIKHFSRGIKSVTTNVAVATKESFDTVKADLPELPKKKAPRKKKKDKVETPKDVEMTDKEEKELSEKMEAYKEELKEIDAETTTEAAQVSSGLESLSNDELDNLLK